MANEKLLVVLALASLPCLAACPSTTLLHTATPLPVGETEFGLGVGAYGIVDAGSGNALQPAGLVEFQFRRGLYENLDGGLRLANIGMIQGDLNWAPINGDRFALSIDPTLSVVMGPGVTATYLWLPLLADVVKTDRATVTLSARIGQFFANDVDDDLISLETSGVLTGAGIGIRLRLSDRLSIMPELHVVQSPIDDVRLYTVSLGFLF